MKSARLLVAAALLALAACGLETIPVLDPPGPTNETLPGSPVFHVNYVVTAIAEFRGFEVYYKFYSSDQALEKNLTTLEALQAAEFRRMCSPGALNEQGLPFNPLIPVDPADRGANFTTDLDFWLTLSPYFVYGAANPPTYDGLRRSAVDFLQQTKTFERASLEPSDEDLAEVNWIQVGIDGQLFLVAYAISYGVLSPATPLYSEPVYLGYMSYTY